MYKKIQRTLLAVFLIISIWIPSAWGYQSVFRSSSSYKYMTKHRSRKYSKTRISVIAHYFRVKNPKLSSKSARTYAGLVESISRKYGVDPFLISSIIIKESTVRVKAKSGRAYGLMQINWKANRKWIPRVFPTVKSAKNLLHSKPNIYVGTYMMRQFIKKNGGNVDKALDRYRGKSLVKYRSRIHSYYSAQVKQFKKKISH